MTVCLASAEVFTASGMGLPRGLPRRVQHFSYGARGFYARPSERSERLKLFVYAQHGHELMG